MTAQTRFGNLSIAVPCRHLLACLQVLKVTPLEAHLADFAFPFLHITSDPLLGSPVYNLHTLSFGVTFDALQVALGSIIGAHMKHSR